MMRSSNRTRITPHCIKQYPGTVLDVLVSSTDNHVNHVNADSPFPRSLTHTESQACIVADAPSISPSINPPAYTSASRHPTDPPTDAPVNVLGKPKQFYEMPLPRLAIVLPMAVRRVSEAAKPWPIHFKLYFLCECGARTAKEGSMATERVHFADHAGYDVRRPLNLFKEFGTYILAVMRAIRTELPSMIAAPLASSTVLHELRRVQVLTQEFISSLVDMAIDYLEELNKCHMVPDLHVMINPFLLEDDDSGYKCNGPLYPFLNHEARALGNLCRSVSNDGHVYWICRAQFHQKYDEKASRRLREVIEENAGSFEDETGTFDVRLADGSKAVAFFEVLSQVQCVQELAVSVAWKAPESILLSLADAVLKSNVLSFNFSDDHQRFLSANDRNTQRRFDPLIQLLTTGRIQLVKLGTSNAFFQDVGHLPDDSSNPTIRKLWAGSVRNDYQLSRFITLVKTCTALQRIVVSFPGHYAASWAVQCIKACPCLEELELSWFTSDYSSVCDLMDYVKQSDNNVSATTGRGRFKVCGVCMWKCSRRALQQCGWRAGRYRCPRHPPRQHSCVCCLTDLVGAIEDVNFRQLLVNGHVDLRPWVQSIEDHGGTSNLQSLTLNDFDVNALREPKPLLEIINRSQGLKRLVLRLTRLSEQPSTSSQEWCLVCLRSRVTTLELRLQGGRIHRDTASLLRRGRLPRLTNIQVFNEGKTNRDIQWLKNMVSEDTRSRLWQAQDSKLDAQALTHLTLNGMHFEDAHWKVLFEALDYKSLMYVTLNNCSIQPAQLTLLLNVLPKDGLLQDGSPVPLSMLNVISFPPEQIFEAGKNILKEELAKRAPYAELII
ncbi:unnamed protein product [Mortierella alpina]